MIKRVAILVVLALLISTLFGQTVRAQDELSLGGGLVGSLPQIVGAYRLGSFSLKAGLGMKNSETVFSAGGLYYFDFWRNLAVEPFLGAGLFLTGGSNGNVPSPPPPPNPGSNTSTEDEGGGLGTIVSLNGGLEIYLTSGRFPTGAWVGVVYIPGSGNDDKGLIDSGISVGLKLRL